MKAFALLLLSSVPLALGRLGDANVKVRHGKLKTVHENDSNKTFYSTNKVCQSLIQYRRLRYPVSRPLSGFTLTPCLFLTFTYPDCASVFF